MFYTVMSSQTMFWGETNKMISDSIVEVIPASEFVPLKEQWLKDGLNEILCITCYYKIAQYRTKNDAYRSLQGYDY